MKLKDYPLSCLVKHYDETRLVAKSDVPVEWLDLEIVHSYIREFPFGKQRVLVVR